MILVTGATGHVGRNVVSRLHAAGVPVRALTRNPEHADFPEAVEVVRGDLTQPESLPAALDGVDRAYLFPVSGEATQGFLDIAAKCELRRVVVLSSLATTWPDSAIGAHHLAVESAVESSGREWTHVRPGAFAVNSLRLWRDSIRAEGVVRAPYGDAALSPIHEDDIAAVAVTALLEDGHAGARYSLTGPESLTQREQVAAIASVLGKEIRFEEVTPEQAEERGIPALRRDALAGSVGRPAEVLPTVEEVTGRPARTFARWVADHTADFK